MKAANKCFSVVGVPQLDFDQCNPDEMIQIVDAVQGIGQQPGMPLWMHEKVMYGVLGNFIVFQQ